MRLVNLKHPDEQASFRQAVQRGLGRDQGLYFPAQIEPMDDIAGLLELPFVARSSRILQHLVGQEMAPEALAGVVEAAFSFPVSLVETRSGRFALELFHGPSLAFKDFGARLLAGCLAHFGDGRETTILTATSGDTGAAVAHAFHGVAGTRAVILYPRGRITVLQEKLFCTLGGNIHTIAVDADFDACQALVKQAFDDEGLRRQLGLNSANSINIARLLAQTCYYFEAAAQLPGTVPVFCVPSGNFGNLTACLVARALGLPMRNPVAATNRNDTVPRYLADGHWAPRATMATLSNAMDISRPNNFPRVEELARRNGHAVAEEIRSVAVTDEQTTTAMRELYASGYLADPHSALAWYALERTLAEDETGVFLCTAHPAKFAEVIEQALGLQVPLPPALAEVQYKPVRSAVISNDFAALRAQLLAT